MVRPLACALPLLAVLALLAGGCTSRDGSTGAASPGGARGASAPAEDATLRNGPWRGVLTLESGELPFGLEIAREDAVPVAWLLNGGDRARIDEIALHGDGLVTMRMSGYDHRIEARTEEQGTRLRGELVLVRRDGAEKRVPFTARHGETWRFFEQPDASTPPANVAGRWAVTFGDGVDASIAVGEFEQNGARVTGTFLTPAGDHRFLAGEVRGNELYLSKFDGGSASLYRATLDPARGTLAGTQSSPTSRTSFVARRDATASLGDAEARTRMRDPRGALDIAFPDLEGRKVSLRDPRFAGKVVVIALAGSWCPNCQDEAAFLSPLYSAKRARGLEIVSLMFENFGDFARAAEAVGRFRARHDIEYTTLIAGVSDKDDAASKLPQLSGVYAFPTTIFIDRTGRVRRIHTGFSGPATGEHYRRLTGQLESLIDELLAEAPPSPTSTAAPDGA